MTDGEIADLIRAARKLHPEMADLIEVAVQTACRLGELQRLRERDCDFTNDEFCAWGGKGKRPRRVPMHQRAWQILRVRCTDRAPDRRLFAIANTNPPFAQIARAAGVANVRFHDLRAAASAFLLESGADLYMVKAITGFAAGTLLKLSTVTDEQKRAAVRRLPTFRDAKGER